MSTIDTSTWHPAYRVYLDCLNMVRLAQKAFDSKPTCDALALLLACEYELDRARLAALGH